jgi:hypothetical protein
VALRVALRITIGSARELDPKVRRELRVRVLDEYDPGEKEPSEFVDENIGRLTRGERRYALGVARRLRRKHTESGGWVD